MNYIGSKQGLLSAIKHLLVTHSIELKGGALDLFSGTGVVAQLLKTLGFCVVANDWQSYSRALNMSYLRLDKFPLLTGLRQDAFWGPLIQGCEYEPIPTYSFKHRSVIRRPYFALKALTYLNQLPGKRGLFFDAYCEKGAQQRLYFSEKNGLRIQAIRDQIEGWSVAGLITYEETQWLIACLIESTDRVANTASVYGAYLKALKTSARKDLDLMAIHPIRTLKYGQLDHQVFSEDALSLVQQLQSTPMTLTYMDPPYNQRQYSSNYHILETLSKWDLDQFVPAGKTGLRVHDPLKSSYCSTKEAKREFEQVFETLNSKYILFSYNNEGLLSDADLEVLIGRRFSILEFKKKKYKRFRSDKDHSARQYSGDQTQEFLILAKNRSKE